MCIYNIYVNIYIYKCIHIYIWLKYPQFTYGFSTLSFPGRHVSRQEQRGLGGANAQLSDESQKLYERRHCGTNNKHGDFCMGLAMVNEVTHDGSMVLVEKC